jgi:hypothetical protein
MDLIEVTEVMGNVGEFVGSFAVLATLIYVSLQLRYSRDLLEENRRIAISQVHHARMETRREIHQTAISNDMSAIFAKLGVMGPAEIEVEDIEQLNEVERIKLTHFLHQQVLMIDNWVFQTSLGLLDSEGFDIPPYLLKRNAEHLSALTEKLNVTVSARTAELWARNMSVQV